MASSRRGLYGIPSTRWSVSRRTTTMDDDDDDDDDDGDDGRPTTTTMTMTTTTTTTMTTMTATADEGGVSGLTVGGGDRESFRGELRRSRCRPRRSASTRAVARSGAREPGSFASTSYRSTTRILAERRHAQPVRADRPGATQRARPRGTGLVRGVLRRVFLRRAAGQRRHLSHGALRGGTAPSAGGSTTITTSARSRVVFLRLAR